jgi:hypothetical protein
MLARTMTMFVGDTRPSVIAHLIMQKSSNILVCTNVQSVYFNYYSYATGAQVATFPKVAAWSDQAGGVAQYDWATDGSETDTEGRFAIWFTLYWGATESEPQNMRSAELNIVNPWEAM